MEWFDIYPIIFLAQIMIAIKPASHVSFNDEYLSKDNCLHLRGILALIILLYHISQKINGGVLLIQIREFGYLVVSVFYFLSGYGMQKQFIRSADYRKQFLIKRLPRIIIPYCFAIILFWIMDNTVMGENNTIVDAMYSLINGRPIVTYSWYIISILVFYIVFWVLMTFFGQSHLRMILVAFIWQLIYMFICWKLGFSQWWYTDSHLLIIGMIWACYEDKLLAILKKHYHYIWPVSGALMIALQLIRLNIQLPGVFQLLIIMIIPIFVVLSTICLLVKHTFRNRILMWIGNISLEIYILQGLAIRGLRSKLMYVNDNFIWVTAVLIITMSLAWLLHLVSSQLYNTYIKTMGN